MNAHNETALVPVGTLENRLASASTPIQTQTVEAEARAAQAWAKERGDYELFVRALYVYISARRRTTELSMPFAPTNGGDRKSEQYKNQNDNDVNLIFSFTMKQWNRRVHELEIPQGRIDEYFDEIIAHQDWHPSLAGLVKFHQNGGAHVSYNSGEFEWYTPPEYIASAHRVMGEIDLDPASSKRANEIVCAKKFYTLADDGLTHKWRGRVWMNPPYAAELVRLFAEKYAAHVSAGDVTEGIVLVNNATETEWFGALIRVSQAVAFPNGRIKFLNADLQPVGAPLQGQAILYAGESIKTFRREFGKYGWSAAL